MIVGLNSAKQFVIVGINFNTLTVVRDAPILPAIFLEKYIGKAKSKMLEK